jgi:hypothetical protein
VAFRGTTHDRIFKGWRRRFHRVPGLWSPVAEGSGRSKHVSTACSLDSLADAIEGAKPDIIVPCDNLAIRHLHQLHSSRGAKYASEVDIPALIPFPGPSVELRDCCFPLHVAQDLPRRRDPHARNRAEPGPEGRTGQLARQLAVERYAWSGWLGCWMASAAGSSRSTLSTPEGRWSRFVGSQGGYALCQSRRAYGV